MGRGGVAESLVNYLQYRDSFAEILDPRTHTIEWLDAQVWSGHAKVWGSPDACLLTEIKHFPTGAFEVHVMIAAGDMGTLVNETIKQVEAWAQEIGALFVTIESRNGWVRVMEKHGYFLHQCNIRKEL